jgi:hypothetical protein
LGLRNRALEWLYAALSVGLFVWFFLIRVSAFLCWLQLLASFMSTPLCALCSRCNGVLCVLRVVVADDDMSVCLFGELLWLDGFSFSQCEKRGCACQRLCSFLLLCPLNCVWLVWLLSLPNRMSGNIAQSHQKQQKAGNAEIAIQGSARITSFFPPQTGKCKTAASLRALVFVKSALLCISFLCISTTCSRFQLSLRPTR